MGKIVETDFVVERGHNFDDVVKRKVMKRQKEGYDVELVAPSTIPTTTGWTYYAILVVSRGRE